MCNQTNTSGEVNFAQNIRYEIELPNFSQIDKSCVNLEDTTEDIYNLIGEIREQVPDDLQDKLDELEEQIEQLTQAQNICNYDITGWVDTSGLVDQCDTPITTLGQLLNYFKDNL